MTDIADLEALARRCEEATGADIELDGAIYDAIGQGCRPWRFTTSLDSAVSLVPEGCGWRIWSPSADSNQRHRATIWAAKGRPMFAPFDVEAATPALALTAASLRARAHLTGERK